MDIAKNAKKKLSWLQLFLNITDAQTVEQTPSNISMAQLDI